MRIDIISLFPEMFAGFLESSIPLRARKKGFLDLQLHNLRDYSTNRYKSVDDYPYGGGAGMVIGIEPVDRCISSLKAERDYDEVIFTSPDAPVLDQPTANTLSLCQNIIILCGHYKGVDERIREHLITREISIGDYVLSGGELAAAVITDAVVRLIPGVLNDETSALSDSFQNGLLSPPVYTRPPEYKGWKVPEVLLGGNDRLKEKWRYEQALARTRERRPSLLGDND
ncbi:MAG: tRNA (guanosine(37)-N1)-methyltransferase TrmD [Bacteroidales bacterium]|nr:tRNA (guanosine(37)-N1)-methyltransferase TrmD [Bacteroidales bacterium]